MSAGPGPDVRSAVDLAIDGTWNARDAATLTGLAPGVLLRSAALSGLTDAGRGALLELGVTDVVDLRSAPEVERQGRDAVPEGITVHRLPIAPGAALTGRLGGGAPGPAALAELAAALSRPGWAHSFMVGIYREMVTDQQFAGQLGAGLGVIADATGATLVHCSAGKDRTGVLVALACTVAGADTDAVAEDFLHSNHAAGAQAAVVPPLPGIDPALLAPFLGVSLDGLRAAQQAITEVYGGIDPFLADIGATSGIAARLRGRLAAG